MQDFNKMLLDAAERIRTSESWSKEKEWYEFDIIPVNLSDEDSRVYDAFRKVLTDMCPYFFDSRRSRYKDERVVVWKDLFRKKRTFSGYTVQRVVFRDPDAGDVFSFTPTLQVDLIDSANHIVEHVHADSMVELCSKALSRAVDLFGLKLKGATNE